MVGMDYEAHARADKAHKLARWCRTQEYSYEIVMSWQPWQWEYAAEFAGVRPPSQKTRGMVIGFLTPTPTIKDKRT